MHLPPLRGFDVVLDTPGRNIRIFRLATTPQAAAEVMALQAKAGAGTPTELFERALGVYKALLEAQEKGAQVRIAYKRTWKTLWLWKQAFLLEPLNYPQQ